MLATTDRVLPVDPASGARAALPTGDIMAAAARIMPGAVIDQVTLLAAPDEYWYGNLGSDFRPALRITFDDPARTWVHIDPATGALLGATNSSGRTYRWLFAVLHVLDPPFLLANRFLREPLMWLLLVLGLIMSTSGIAIGWRRLRGGPALSSRRK